jgi:hypothetical protein
MVRKSWWLIPFLLSAGAAHAETPPVERAQVAARAESLFAKADTNHDNWLSRQEYQAAILAIARKYDPKIPSTGKGMDAAMVQFDVLDPTASGRVSHADFVAAALAHFDGADLNHNGKVTPDEARKAEKIKQRKLKASQSQPAQSR